MRQTIANVRLNIPPIGVATAAYSFMLALAIAGCASNPEPPPAVEAIEPGWTSEPEKPPVEVHQSEPTPPKAPEFTTGAPDELETSLQHHYTATLASQTTALHDGEVGYYMDTQEARLIQQLQNSGISAIRYKDTLALTLGNGLFATDSTKLSAEAREKLTPIAGVLVEYDRTRISIYGHTDNTGDPAYNQQLSVRRALTIARFLADSGVARQRIFVAGLGQTRPIAPNDSEAGRAQNRRIELQIEPLVIHGGETTAPKVPISG